MKSNHIITFYAIGLLVYAGWRTLDYMQGSLVGVDRTLAYLVACVFLFASEIGLLLWLHKAMPDATTDVQETVATAMIYINFIGSMILGLADVLKHNQFYEVDLSALDPIILLAPWVLIAANVFGYIQYHLNDASEQVARAERRLAHAEARLEIDARRAAVANLDKDRKTMADKMAVQYYREVLGRISGRSAKRFLTQVDAADAQPSAAVPVTPGHNGSNPIRPHQP